MILMMIVSKVSRFRSTTFRCSHQNEEVINDSHEWKNFSNQYCRIPPFDFTVFTQILAIGTQKLN